MRFRLFRAAAEQTGDLVVPPPERAVGRSLLEGGVDSQDRLERFFDRLAVLEALAQSERLGERAHVRREPEMPLGTIGLDRDRLARRLDAPLEDRALLVFRRVAPEPVVGARQLPCGVERLRLPGELRA